jgi:hypothetical protein
MYKRRLNLALVFGGILLISLLSCPKVQADSLTPVEVDRVYNITWDNPTISPPDFANASGTGKFFSYWTGNSGDTGTFKWIFTSNSGTTPTYGTDANLSINNFSWNDSTLTASGTVKANATLTSPEYTFVENFFNPRLFVSSGLNCLQVAMTSDGGVASGYPYKLSVKFPGDWSTPGTAPGDYVLSYNQSSSSNWTMTPNFDGTNTTFSFESKPTDGSNIGLSITLYGAPVPVPSALLLFGTGLMGLAAVRRRF